MCVLIKEAAAVFSYLCNSLDITATLYVWQEVCVYGSLWAFPDALSFWLSGAGRSRL
jgi:hypothetical protein